LEELAIFSSRGVTFLDFSDWNGVGVVDFILNLSVKNGLDVVLDVVNMLVNIANTFNFFDFNVTVVSVDNVLQMLVVVSYIWCSRVELGSDRVVMSNGVVEA